VKHTGWIGLLVGLVLFTAVVAWQGAGGVLSALSVAGWGILVVTAYHLVPLVADGLAWRALFDPAPPRLGRLVWARWIGDALNGLLPAGQVAGDVVRARLVAATTSAAGSVAGATVVVDVTLSLLSQIVFTLAGVGLLVLRLGRSDAALGILASVLVFVVLLALFYRVQHRGLFGALARVLATTALGRSWLDMVGGADRLDTAVGELWRRPRPLVRSTAWNLASWVSGTGEVWLAMWFLGHPVSLADALLLESLGQAARNAAFFIPGGLGVQEGSYLSLGVVLGISPELTLALSLAKRAREVLLGVPGLLAWQAFEGRALAARRRSRARSATNRLPPRRPRS
jgi:putative membrane protein